MTLASKTPDELFSSLRRVQQEYSDSLPPVHLWQPELNGDLDMRIDREGRWYYQGGQIKRPAMVKMFSSILKREANDYFLVTPAEKWRISVDIAPFIFNQMRVEGSESEPAVVLTTNVGNDVLLGPNNPLWVEQAPDSSPIPKALVRDGMPGLVSRNVFYELVELCFLKINDAGDEELCFKSGGSVFSLGSVH